MDDIFGKINTCLRQNGRTMNDLTVLAVSKKQTLDAVMAVAQNNIFCFGENYLQEALAKFQTMPIEFRRRTQWHMIGALQSNKLKRIAEHFDWVQTVTRLIEGQKLNKYRAALQHALPLNVCVQVNMDGSLQKNGIEGQFDQVFHLVSELNALSHLQVRGIMVMPNEAPTQQLRSVFESTQRLYTRIKFKLPHDQSIQFDTLSMGMSADFNLAIEAGATMIRIGTALFGSRN